MNIKQPFNYFVLLLIVGSSISCIRLANLQFDKENLFYSAIDSTKSTVELAKTVPVSEYNNGVIADFNTGLKFNWRGSSKINLSSKEGAMIIDASEVGISYDRFSHRLTSFCDFSKTNIIKVRARSEGQSVPLLRIDLKDANGFTTNNVDTKTRILINENYIDYYFKFEGKFEQGWPIRHEVDKSKISELEFLINPGGNNYTGRIMIDEIVVVDAIVNNDEVNSKAVSLESNNKEDLRYWWSNNPKYSIDYDDKNKAIKIKSRGNGKKYESFGRGFTAINLSENPVLRIKAKAIGKVAPDLRIDLVDINGNATNGVAIVKSIPNDNTFRDYYFDFNNKLYQGWPQTLRVDVNKISELMLLLNPGQMNFIGTLLISEIEIVKNYQVEKPVSVNSFNNGELDLKNKSIFWVNEAFDIQQNNGDYSISKREAGVDNLTLGLGFDVKNCSSYTEITIITNTADSSSSIKLYDSMGNPSLPIKANAIRFDEDGMVATSFLLPGSSKFFDNTNISSIVFFFNNSIFSKVSKLNIKDVKFEKKSITN